MPLIWSCVTIIKVCPLACKEKLLSCRDINLLVEVPPLALASFQEDVAVLEITGRLICVFCWHVGVSCAPCNRWACRREGTHSTLTVKDTVCKILLSSGQIFVCRTHYRACQWTTVATNLLLLLLFVLWIYFNLNVFIGIILNFYRYKGQNIGSGPLKVTLKVTHLATWQPLFPILGWMTYEQQRVFVWNLSARCAQLVQLGAWRGAHVRCVRSARWRTNWRSTLSRVKSWRRRPDRWEGSQTLGERVAVAGTSLYDVLPESVCVFSLPVNSPNSYWNVLFWKFAFCDVTQGTVSSLFRLEKGPTM